MLDFEALLNKNAAEVKPDSPLPVGTWKLKGIGANKNPGTETMKPTISFGYVAVAPQEDVDPSETADEAWMGRRVWKRFYVEGEGDVANVVKHIAKHGIEVTDGRTVAELLEAFGKVKPVIFAHAGVRVYTNKDGEQVAETVLKDFAAAS